MTARAQLLDAVGRAVSDLQTLIDAVEQSDPALRHSLRSNLHLQLRSLRQVEEAVRSGAPSRRVWSLGQASIPVMSSLLNGVARSDLGPLATDGSEQVQQCRESMADLGQALSRFAEGR